MRTDSVLKTNSAHQNLGCHIQASEVSRCSLRRRWNTFNSSNAFQGLTCGSPEFYGSYADRTTKSMFHHRWRPAAAGGRQSHYLPLV